MIVGNDINSIILPHTDTGTLSQLDGDSANRTDSRQFSARMHDFVGSLGRTYKFTEPLDTYRFLQLLEVRIDFVNLFLARIDFANLLDVHIVFVNLLDVHIDFGNLLDVHIDFGNLLNVLALRDVSLLHVRAGNLHSKSVLSRRLHGNRIVSSDRPFSTRSSFSVLLGRFSVSTSGSSRTIRLLQLGFPKPLGTHVDRGSAVDHHQSILTLSATILAQGYVTDRVFNREHTLFSSVGVDILDFHHIVMVGS